MSYSFIESRGMGRLPILGSLLCARQITCENVIIEGTAFLWEGVQVKLTTVIYRPGGQILKGRRMRHFRETFF